MRSADVLARNAVSLDTLAEALLGHGPVRDYLHGFSLTSSIRDSYAFNPRPHPDSMLGGLLTRVRDYAEEEIRLPGLIRHFTWVLSGS